MSDKNMSGKRKSSFAPVVLVRRKYPKVDPLIKWITPVKPIENDILFGEFLEWKKQKDEEMARSELKLSREYFMALWRVFTFWNDQEDEGLMEVHSRLLSKHPEHSLLGVYKRLLNQTKLSSDIFRVVIEFADEGEDMVLAKFGGCVLGSLLRVVLNDESTTINNHDGALVDRKRLLPISNEREYSRWAKNKNAKLLLCNSTGARLPDITSYLSSFVSKLLSSTQPLAVSFRAEYNTDDLVSNPLHLLQTTGYIDTNLFELKQRENIVEPTENGMLFTMSHMFLKFILPKPPSSTNPCPRLSNLVLAKDRRDTFHSQYSVKSPTLASFLNTIETRINNCVEFRDKTSSMNENDLTELYPYTFWYTLSMIAKLSPILDFQSIN